MRNFLVCLVALLLVAPLCTGQDSDDWPTVSCVADVNALSSITIKLRVIGADDAILKAISSHLQLRELDISRSDVYEKDYTAKGLVHIGKLRNLEYLRVSNSYADGGASVSEGSLSFLQNLKSLRSLNVSNRNWIGPVDFKYVADLPRLKSLVVSNCAGFGDVAMKIVSGSSTLENLWLSVGFNCRDLKGKTVFLPDITINGIACIGEMKALRTLSIYGHGVGDAVDDSAFARFSNLPVLESLTISRCSQYTAKGIRWLSKSKSLRRLDLDSKELGDKALMYLSQIRKLEVLDISGWDNVTGSGVAQLGKLENLQELYAGGCPGMDDEGLLGLAESKSLRNIRVCGGSGYYFSFAGEEKKWKDGFQVPATSIGLVALGKIKTLEVLNARNLDSVNDEVLVALGKLPNLRELVICPRHRHKMDVTDVGLKALSKCTSLRVLDIYRATKATKVGVGELGKLVNLERLHIGGCGMLDGATLIKLSGLHLLKDLELGDIEFGTTGFAAICELKNLEKFRVWHANILGTDGFKNIGQLTKLKKLMLWDCKGITDEHLRYIADLKNLERCRLNPNADVSETAIVKLKTALPRCKVNED